MRGILFSLGTYLILSIWSAGAGADSMDLSHIGHGEVFFKFVQQSPLYKGESFEMLYQRHLSDSQDYREKELISLWGDRYSCIFSHELEGARILRTLSLEALCPFGEDIQKYGIFGILGKKLNHHLNDASSTRLSELFYTAYLRLDGEISTDAEFLDRIRYEPQALSPSDAVL